MLTHLVAMNQWLIHLHHGFHWQGLQRNALGEEMVTAPHSIVTKPHPVCTKGDTVLLLVQRPGQGQPRLAVPS
jgi:hypothetical protein